MPAANDVLDGAAARIAAAIGGSSSSSDLASLEEVLRRLASDSPTASYTQGFAEGQLAVVTAVLQRNRSRGLALQASTFEPGSLPARLLLEIAAGVRRANCDIAQRLDTDQWQLSRAGRRLRDAGLAVRVREGRLNEWSLTQAGKRAAAELRSK